MTLAYKLKLAPSRNKADTLANLASLFRRAHTDCTRQIGQAEEARCPSTKGLGEFIGRAYRRAWIDWQHTRSDGYRGSDLRPILKRQHDRRAMQQEHDLERSYIMSPSRQVIAREARKAVTVCLRTGRGIALEDLNRLIRWRQHASRFFGRA